MSKCSAKNRRCAGGDKWCIGGTLRIEDGATLDVAEGATVNGLAAGGGGGGVNILGVASDGYVYNFDTHEKISKDELMQLMMNLKPFIAIVTDGDMRAYTGLQIDVYDDCGEVCVFRNMGGDVSTKIYTTKEFVKSES